MAKVITVASQKGGVGKTTTVLNLGYSLSRLGQKILVMDADPQGGIAIASNLKKRTTQGLVDILKGQEDPSKLIIPTKDDSMAFLGVGAMEPEEVMYYEKEALKGNLSKAIHAIAQQYETVLIDAPAGAGSIAYALLAVSNSVILPVNCRTMNMKTMAGILKLIQRVKARANKSLTLEGVVFTMMDEQSPYQREIQQEILQSFPPSIFFETVIPYDEMFEWASMRSVAVGMLPDGQEAARPYLDLAMELKVRELQSKMKGASNEDVEGLF